MNPICKNSPTYSLFWIMLIAFIFVLLKIQAQSLLAGEWQKKYDYEQVRQGFEQPPLWYAPHTFWFWQFVYTHNVPPYLPFNVSPYLIVAKIAQGVG